VLHHTPDPERAFARVAAVVRTGGAFAVYVYARYGPSHRFSDAIRRLTTRLPLPVLRAVSALAVPAYYLYRVPVVSGPLGMICPISQHPDWRWRWLDTFDWYSPKYQWKVLYPEVFRWFQSNRFREHRAVRRADPHARLEGRIAPHHVRHRGHRQARPRGDGRRGAPQAHARRAAPSRPRRRGAVDRRARRTRPPAARDRGRGGRASADAQRGRTRVDRLQRRGLQPRRARRGLRARGHRYRTRSDTETVLHLYEEEGIGCVERLRGMFAFAIWDRDRGRLLLARDRLGIKPLYYAVTDHELLFASEIKAILAAMDTRPRFNEAVLPEFLANRFVAGEETFFRRSASSRPATR
jgi:hypothetical protein